MLALLLCLTTASIGVRNYLLPTHPQFGSVFETTASDLDESRSDRLGVFLRRHLPQRVVRSPRFPSRFKDQPRYLHLGDQQLEWSKGDTNAGWLYFWGIDPKEGCVPEQWELAPCGETNLMQVTRMPSEFYAVTHPSRATVFGKSSSTNAIGVRLGQILFARRSDETNRIYVIKLKKQDENRIVVHYCVTGLK